ERICNELALTCNLRHIHQRKEIENYLLVPEAISRCVQNKLRDREKRGSKVKIFDEDVGQLIREITEQMKAEIFGQFSAKAVDQIRELNKHYDSATLQAKAHQLFEDAWKDPEKR